MKNLYKLFLFCITTIGCSHEKKTETENNTDVKLPTQYKTDSLTVNKINASQIPKTIQFDGNFKEGYKWNDKNGESIVFTSETGIFRNSKIKHEHDGENDAELYVYCYTGDRLNWKIYDFVHDCPVDLTAEFIDGTFQVTDLNKNGTPEVWTMYKTVCRGDVSPSELKIIMYEGSQKYAMRGETKVMTGIDEQGNAQFYGGDYKMDKFLQNGPAAFKSFAEKLWNNNVAENSN